MDTQQQTGYQAAEEEAVFYQPPQAGALRISGQDPSGFLQRQTTNDVRLLASDHLVLTVLTSSTARILDVLTLLPESPSEQGQVIIALTLPGQAPATTRFLKSRIFFNDRITVEDISESVIQFDLFGPGASNILEKFGADRMPKENEILSLTSGSFPLKILGMMPGFSLGIRLFAPIPAGEALRDRLEEAGAVLLDNETYHVLRVEAGLPAAGSELNENFTPLENGLAGAISDKKGCYTGQEIIARQITYDKVTQHLTGLRMERTALAGERIWADGKAVGEVTSSALSPRFGSIALGIVKRPHNQPGHTLQVGRSLEDTLSAMVVSLPFSDSVEG